jgi:hypothetical protein
MNKSQPHKPKQPHKNIVGEPINFRGLTYAPVNEQGVVLLFGMLAKELGFHVQLVRQGYPDCKAVFKMGNGRYEEVNIEFEFRSSGFKCHMKEEVRTDFIVCWVHDWRNCPPSIKVLELSRLIHSGKLDALPIVETKSEQPQRHITHSHEEERIYDLLKAIALDESKVVCRRGGDSYLQTPFHQVERICLSSNKALIMLGLCFGDTQRQAIAFYNSSPKIRHLENTQWKIRPGFHVAFRSQGLISFESEDTEHYLQFWKANVDRIRQQKRSEVQAYFEWLAENRVIKMTKEAQKMLKEKFFDTKMSRLNMCPGFVLEFKIAKTDELDDSDKLKGILAEKINEALTVVALDGRKVLKQF